MELLDRYLQSVKSYLPEKQRDDIVKELSENILSEMEDREGGLGRKLDEAEQAAILKQHGHPMEVAGRYLPRQYLIGPAVFPYYWFTLKRTAPLVALLLCVIGAGLMPYIAHVVEIASGKPATSMVGSPGAALVWFGGVMLAWLVAVTLIFATFESYQAKFHMLEKWNPQTLAPLAKDGDYRPRAKVIASIVANSLILPVWLVSPHYTFLLLGPGALWIQFTRASQLGFTLIPLLVFAQIARDFLSLIRPHWTRWEAAARFVIHGASAVALYFLAQVGEWVAPVDGAGAAASKAARNVNLGCQIGFSILTGVAAAAFVWACWQYGRQLMGQRRRWVAGLV